MARRAAAIATMTAAVLAGGCESGPCGTDYVYGIERCSTGLPQTLAQRDDDGNHPGAVGFPVDQVDDLLSGAAHMYVGQTIPVRIDYTTALRVQRWNSSDARVAAVVATVPFGGVLEGRAVGDAAVTATLRYTDGSTLEVPLAACGGGCGYVRTLHVVERQPAATGVTPTTRPGSGPTPTRP